MSARDPSTYGKVERHPDVCGGAWRIAGTRITTRRIARMVLSGLATEWILREFASLVEADVEAARNHEHRMLELDRREAGA